MEKVFSFVAVVLLSWSFPLGAQERFVNPPSDSWTLTCEKPKTLTIPPALMPKAKLKARLIQLLRQSLEDDSEGKTDVKREKEIKHLAKKVSHD